MLIDLVANLEWHSVNLQLDSVVVVVIHVNVTDEKQTQAYHTQLPDQPAIFTFMSNNVALTGLQSSHWPGSGSVCSPSSVELRILVLGCSPEPKPGRKSEVTLCWSSRDWTWWFCLWAPCIQLEWEEKYNQWVCLFVYHAALFHLQWRFLFTCRTLGQDVEQLI